MNRNIECSDRIYETEWYKKQIKTKKQKNLSYMFWIKIFHRILVITFNFPANFDNFSHDLL